jgi:hypothetical protein
LPRLRFRNFSDLGFLQSIDKPRYFTPLLVPHADYFARQGLDISALTNDDACDRRLLAVFTKPDEEMPGDLLEALYALDDLAAESAHDRLLDEAERCGISLAEVGDDLNPGELAIAVYLSHPRLIRICHQRTIHRRIRNYTEFQSAHERRISIESAKAKRPELERELSKWFESKNRSPACQIYAYEEKGEVRFEITHGQLFRTDGTWTKRLEPSRVAFRPQKHDSVIYDRHTKVLKINAQTVGERELYRETFGKVFFDDTEYFPEGDLYTLQPLRKSNFHLAIAEGIENVRLTEVWIVVDDAGGLVQMSRAYDLINLIERHGKPNLAEGRIVRAKFLIKYMSGGRPRKLELRPPNIAEFDRDRDGVAAEAFLRANRFLKIKPAHAGPSPILEPA